MTTEATETHEIEEDDDKRADSTIRGKRTEDVLRELADGVIVEDEALNVVRALVRRIDRKLAARAARADAPEG